MDDIMIIIDVGEITFTLAKRIVGRNDFIRKGIAQGLIDKIVELDKRNKELCEENKILDGMLGHQNKDLNPDNVKISGKTNDDLSLGKNVIE